MGQPPAARKQLLCRDCGATVSLGRHCSAENLFFFVVVVYKRFMIHGMKIGHPHRIAENLVARYAASASGSLSCKRHTQKYPATFPRSAAKLPDESAGPLRTVAEMVMSPLGLACFTSM